MSNISGRGRIKRDYSSAAARHQRTIDALWLDEQRRQQQSDNELRAALIAYMNAGSQTDQKEPS